jgi:RND family efflux transporter MFP subunit
MIRNMALLAVAGLSLAACQKKAPPPPPPPTVGIAHPLVQRIVDWDDYVGRFESLEAVELRPRVSGYLQSVNFRDGQTVRKGELLFVIDPRPYQATLAQAAAQVARARATLNNAQVELRRAQSLFEAKAGSQQELEARRAAAAQARADLGATLANQRTAALNVEFTHVRAPLSGRISDRRVAPGNLVTADQTVLTSIVNDNPIRFTFEASESLFLKRQREKRRTLGDPVDIRLQDEPTYRWHGKLEFIDNALDTNSGVIRGRAVLPNPGGLLTPGLFGHMRLPGSTAYNGLLVPDAAIQQDQQRQIVYVVGPDDVVKQKVVEVGPLVSGLRAIRSGITASDWVIVDGTVRAKAGSKVTPKQTRISLGKDDDTPPLVAPTASSISIAR